MKVYLTEMTAEDHEEMRKWCVALAVYRTGLSMPLGKRKELNEFTLRLVQTYELNVVLDAIEQAEKETS